MMTQYQEVDNQMNSKDESAVSIDWLKYFEILSNQSKF